MQTLVAIVVFLGWLSGAEPNYHSAPSFLNGPTQISYARGIRPYET
jgi:hypothetical protein